jgi:hypothetical protein
VLSSLHNKCYNLEMNSRAKLEKFFVSTPFSRTYNTETKHFGCDSHHRDISTSVKMLVKKINRIKCSNFMIQIPVILNPNRKVINQVNHFELLHQDSKWEYVGDISFKNEKNNATIIRIWQSTLQVKQSQHQCTYYNLWNISCEHLFWEHK